MIPRSDVIIGQCTHVGMERSENQDFYGYWESEDESQWQQKGRIIVVCDGMGGHAGGEVASQLAVKSIIEYYSMNSAAANPGEGLRAAIEGANRAIWDYGTQNVQLKGMGSTTVCMAIKDGVGYFAHVGDSRCYLVRQGQLIQCTKDHSLVQQMVDEHLLREEDMESHPEKNVILRSLGVKPDVEVEVQAMPLQPGDIYCLSTDGLTGLVSKEECRQILLLNRDNPMQAAQMLVDLANKYGGYDNVTVQVVHVVSLKPGEAPQGGEQPITGVYSEDDVQRSIAEARAKAAAAGGSGGPKSPPTQLATTAVMSDTSQVAQAVAAQQAAQAAQAGGAAQKKKSKLPLILAILAILGGAAGAAAYFLMGRGGEAEESAPGGAHEEKKSVGAAESPKKAPVAGGPAKPASTQPASADPHEVVALEARKHMIEAKVEADRIATRTEEQSKRYQGAHTLEQIGERLLKEKKFDEARAKFNSARTLYDAAAKK